MKLLRIKAVTKKELLQIWRDPLSLAMAFMMPVMLLFIFGYAITLDVNNLKTVVYDLDKSSASRELIEAFSSSGYFTVVGNVNQQKEIDRYLDTGQAFVVISIPKDFSEKMKTGRDTSLQVIVDGSDSNTATIALGYISAITERYSLRTRGGSITPLIDPRVRVWYNPELKSRNFIIPGLIAIIMAVITALLTSLTIAREWERGTMEQLIATPIKTPELILGKLIPYFFIGFIDVIFSVLLAVFLFEVPLRGGPLLLMLLSSIFLFGGLSLGILISTVAKSQLVSSQISMLATFLPAFLLSGFMFSTLLRSSAIGCWLGITPGGAIAASFMGYNLAKRFSKDPESFGKGRIEGVFAPETAAHASGTSALLPMLALGIPGSGTAAILLGGLMVWGLNPGPLLFVEHKDFVWGLIASMYLGNVVGLVIVLTTVPIFAAILRVPFAAVAPMIVVSCAIGAYAIQNAMFDVWLMLLFGVVGYVFKKIGIPLAPFTLALVLGNRSEDAFRLSMIGAGGDMRVFWSNGLVGSITTLAFILLFWPLIGRHFRTRGRPDACGGLASS